VPPLVSDAVAAAAAADAVAVAVAVADADADADASDDMADDDLFELIQIESFHLPPTK
jgi:hypothetical protein